MADSVETKGFEQAEAKLDALPTRLRAALVDGTKQAVSVVADVLRANTPVYERGLTLGHVPMRLGKPYPPGTLLAGWRTKVTVTFNGAQGVVSNKVYYRLFVERGAHPGHPMRAHPFTERGVAETQGVVQSIFEAETASVVAEADS